LRFAQQQEADRAIAKLAGKRPDETWEERAVRVGSGPEIISVDSE
jgi:hypothetical protein